MRKCLNALAAVALLAAILAGIIVGLPRFLRGLAETDEITDTAVETLSEGNPVFDRPVSYTRIRKTADEIFRGPLILVNGQHEYRFPDIELVTVYGNKSQSYKVRDTAVSLERETLDAWNAFLDGFAAETGEDDILVVSGFRSYESQMQIYSDRVDADGLQAAMRYVALAGFSEHHTGLAMDLMLYTDSGVSREIEKSKYYQRFLDTCHRGGFVKRYDAAKYDITAIEGEEWHFRYVGVPHAYYMKKNELCLEEYISLLRAYPFDGRHLKFGDDQGNGWEVYFVPADPESADAFDIPVPDALSYTVSGNNIDGFIVAACLTG